MDVGQAFVHAELDEDVWTQVPVQLDGLCVKLNGKEEKLQAGQWWQVKKALYGLRRAPKLWQDHLTEILTTMGYKRLKVEPAIFVSEDGQIILLIHVDDLLAGGPRKRLKKLFTDLGKKVVLKLVGEVVEVGDAVVYLS